MRHEAQARHVTYNGGTRVRSTLTCSDPLCDWHEVLDSGKYDQDRATGLMVEHDALNGRTWDDARNHLLARAAEVHKERKAAERKADDLLPEHLGAASEQRQIARAHEFMEMMFDRAAKELE